MSASTNFREYSRGQTPGDWELVAPAGEPPWPVRSIDGDAHRASWLHVPDTKSRAALLWTVVDFEPSHANQEILALLQITATGSCSALVVRAGGAAGVEDGAYVVLDTVGQTIGIDVLLGGSVSSSSSAAIGFAVAPFRPVWVRLRANGTSLQARAWADGTAEPGTWTTSLTAASPADGRLGISRDAAGIGPEVHYVAYAVAGGTAPGPSSIPAGLATWLMHPHEEVEYTLEVHALDPESEIETTLYYSTRGRTTGHRDWPASAEMPPLLDDPGSASFRLAEDQLFGRAEVTLARITLRNLLGELSRLLDLTLAGRRVVMRIGLARWETHRWFEPILSGLVEGEPAIDDKVALSLQSPFRALEPELSGRTHVGIRTGLQLTGEGHSASYLSTYDRTRFLVAARMQVGSAVERTFGIRRGDSVTAENWNLYVERETGAVVGRASIGGVASALYLRSADGVMLDGQVHSLALGVDATNRAYLLVDRVPVAEVTPGEIVDLSADDVVLHGFDGDVVWDIRIMGYCPDTTDAQALLETRADEDDPDLVALWPCDDGIGSVATDYAVAGNHLALAGTEGVDHVWVATNAGEPDQAGIKMSLALGAVQSAPGLLVDQNRQRFRLSDGALPGQIVVRSKGTVDTSWSDVGDGVIEFPSLTDEPVTWDHREKADTDDSHLKLSTLLETVLRDRLGLDETGYDPLALPAIEAAAPFRAQVYLEGEARGAEVLETLLSPVGGHYRLDRDGRIVPGLLHPPVSPGPVEGEAVLELLGSEGRSRVSWSTTTGDLPAGSWAIAFWVKPFAIDRLVILGDDADPFPSYAAIADNLSVSNGGYYIGLYRGSQGSIGFHIPWLSSAYFVTPPGAVPYAAWTFVVARYNSSTSTITIEVAAEGVSKLIEVYRRPSTTGAPFATARGLDLGGRLRETKRGSLTGGLAHYQVWSGYLDDDFVADLISRKGVPPALYPLGVDLEFYAPLNEGGGDQAQDLVSGTWGRVWGARWAPRMVFDFRLGMSRATGRFKRLRPAWNVVLAWGQLIRPLTDQEIAATVSAADRARLKRQWRRHRSPAPRVRELYRDAREVILESGPLVRRGDVVHVARNLRHRYERARIQGVVTDAPRPSISLQLGDEVWVYHPRIGGSGGGAFRVVGATPQQRTLRSQLDLWGSRLPRGQAAILADGAGELLTDDGDILSTDE